MIKRIVYLWNVAVYNRWAARRYWQGRPVMVSREVIVVDPQRRARRQARWN
jgi:hypothetical protein